MEPATVKEFFRQSDVVRHYADAAQEVGLWVSEEKIFTRLFNKEDSLLELGCGGGRIALGMWEIGYRNLLGIDYAKEMVYAARAAAHALDYRVFFQHGDATSLKFDNEVFDGAIFGFNGLMQIPQRKNRLKAMSEIYRVIKPGSWFVFTSHDRDNPKHHKYWKSEQRRWNDGTRKPELDDFGDLYNETEHGLMFIHSPRIEEIRADLKSVGFRVECDVWRRQIAKEPPRVTKFADECRFWIAQKPKEAGSDEGATTNELE